MNKHQSVEDFLIYLENKGFKFQEDAIGFIYFGKRYTDASDTIVNTAIEITLKAQKIFDSSFYISVLEILQSQNIKTRREAFQFIQEKGVLAESV
ncbi:hypothetical protein JOC86_000814 [Bacillus pakistanensis]|uniref:Uncharacterized protein n=1 Tax=Rossellomorea pakistanensis TaxID=992288 RepID=A0ABS2N8U6_9BACI|nr:DUF6123 family protein [Bacillus pakistanensis]MBM7584277.1 hypothetical protein [Bacillus pakistanensis]